MLVSKEDDKRDNEGDETNNDSGETHNSNNNGSNSSNSSNDNGDSNGNNESSESSQSKNNIDNAGFQSLSIHLKHIEPISMKHKNCIVLGRLKTHLKKSFKSRVTFTGDKKYSKKNICQVGCVMIPKNKGYLTRFPDAINTMGVN